MEKGFSPATSIYVNEKPASRVIRHVPCGCKLGFNIHTYLYDDAANGGMLGCRTLDHVERTWMSHLADRYQRTEHLKGESAIRAKGLQQTQKKEIASKVP